jgi:hypothetical protein
MLDPLQSRDFLLSWSIPVCETCGQQMRLIDDTNMNRITWKCAKDDKVDFGKLVRAVCQLHHVDKDYDVERSEYFCRNCNPEREAELEQHEG